MTSADLGLGLASAMLDAGQYAAAREALSILIMQSDQKTRAHALALRGWSWFREREYGHALGDFNHALAIEPDAANTLFLRARCREELDDPAGALIDFEAVLAINPATPDAWDGASMVHRYFGRTHEADECAANAAKARAAAE